MSRFETSENLPKYFHDIDRLANYMTKEEEQELAVRIRLGDKAAFERLVTANLKYVVTVANGFIGLGLPIEDLVEEGNLGLMEAAIRYDETNDTKFLTYAKFWIRKRINLALCEHGRTVRLPVNQEYQIYKDKKKGTASNLTNVRIDSKVGEDEKGTLGDLMLHQDFADPFEGEDDRMLLSKLLGSLQDHERQVISLFYGLEGDENLSTKDVARIVGRTPAEVNRTLKMARSKMRKKAGIHERTQTNNEND